MSNKLRFIVFLFSCLIFSYLTYKYFQNDVINYAGLKEADIKSVEDDNVEVKNSFGTSYSEIPSDLNKNESDVLLSISIPKINVYNNVYNFNSSKNDINKNVLILNESDMPDIPFGNLILGAHSGSGRLAYFKDLDKLTIGDDIIIYYKNKTYLYRVVNFYVDSKDGSIEIIRDYNKDSITLYTCMPNDKKNFLVIIGEKISVQ